MIGADDQPGLRGRAAADRQPQQHRPRRGDLPRDHHPQDRQPVRHLLLPGRRVRRRDRAAGRQRSKRYGLSLGTAFQIQDDILDIVGDAGTVGKTLGIDVEKGKMTLPMIHFLRTAPPEHRTLLRSLLTGRDAGQGRADPQPDPPQRVDRNTPATAPANSSTRPARPARPAGDPTPAACSTRWRSSSCRGRCRGGA